MSAVYLPEKHPEISSRIEFRHNIVVLSVRRGIAVLVIRRDTIVLNVRRGIIVRIYGVIPPFRVSGGKIRGILAETEIRHMQNMQNRKNIQNLRNMKRICRGTAVGERSLKERE